MFFRRIDSFFPGRSARAFRCGTLSLLLALVSLNTTVAGDGPLVRLEGPVVTRGDWGHRALSAADLNGNGRMDLAVINNNRARIDFFSPRASDDEAERPTRRRTGFRWQPVVEDGFFLPDHLVTGHHMNALALGDLNQNGLTDLAFTSRAQTIQIYHQEEPGQWREGPSFPVEGVLGAHRTLLIEDFDENGYPDILALTSGLLYIFSGGEDGFGEPQTYPLPETNNHTLTLRDITGNGLKDVLYVVPNHAEALRIRPQVAPGVLGPEISLAMDAPRTAPLFLPPPETESTTALQLVSLQDSAGLIQFLSLVKETLANGDESVLPLPLTYTLPFSGSTPPSYLTGSFRDDQRIDVLVADPGGAQILLYSRLPEGGFGTPEKFPSLADIRGLGRGRFIDPDEESIAVISFREEMVGLTRFTGEGRLAFPTPLPFNGKPSALAVGDLRERGLDDLVIAGQNDRGQRELTILAWSVDEEEWQTSTYALTGLRADPGALRLFDANGNGRLDIGVFIPFSPLRIFVQEEDGTFTDVSQQSGYRGSLVDRLEAAQFSLADINGDGFAEMLIARGGFIRALRLDDAGTLQIVDQINARGSEDDLTLVLPDGVDEQGYPRLLAFARGRTELHRFTRDPRGVYRFREAISTGALDPLGTFVGPSENGNPDILFFGRRQVWWLPAEPQNWQLEVTHTLESEASDITFTHLAMGDFIPNGKPEIIVLDGRSSRSLEILSNLDGLYEPVFYFTLFETSPHFQGRRGSSTEPREILVADLTGNGRDDIVLLVHDRLLLYPQSDPPPEETN